MENYIGRKIRIQLDSNQGFTTVTGILMSQDEEFFVLDTYKGIEYVNKRFIVSFVEVESHEED
jgi:RNase P/RNase MRP subunit p29